MVLQSEGIRRALAQRGFPYLKLELEADVGSGDRDRDVAAEVCREWLSLMPEETRDQIVYSKAYYDGSVDTEITYTIPIALIDQLPKMLSDFRKACHKIGRLNVENAGLHITVLPHATYPTRGTLPRAKVRNFRLSMSKLIEALYLTACDGEKTRSLHFRAPYCSQNAKYSAIYTRGDTCLEYRIFDPCYDDPERIWLYLNSIVQTLKFYSDKRVLSLERPDGKLSQTSWLPNLFQEIDDEWLFGALEAIYPDQLKLERLKKYYERKVLGRKELFKELANLDTNLSFER